MASKKQSSENTSQTTPSASNKYLMYVGIAIAALVVFWLVASGSRDDSTSAGAESANAQNQQQTEQETQQMAVDYVELQNFAWAADIQDRCEPCLESPTGCSNLAQSIAYKCEIPAELPSDGTWSCTRRIEGVSTTKGSCSDQYKNYIRVRPDQANDIFICCSYSYVDPATGTTRKSEEYCDTREMPRAC